MTIADPQLQELQERRRRKRWRSHLTYSAVLLLLMLGSGTAAGLYAYKFGQEALKGVKPSPPSVRLPTIAPEVNPPAAKPAPKPAPKQSNFLDEQTTIATNRAIFQERLGTLTRPQRPPTPVAKDPQFIFEQNYETRLAQLRERINASSVQRFQELRAPIDIPEVELEPLDLGGLNPDNSLSTEPFIPLSP